MAKIYTIPAMPQPGRRRGARKSDPKYVEGQRLLVEAMRYLAQSNPETNRDAVSLLSEHFRSNFRMSDRPSPTA